MSMDIKSCIEFSTKRGDRVYTFHVPAGAPFGEMYDAAFECLGQFMQMAQEAAQKAAPKEVSDVQAQGN